MTQPSVQSGKDVVDFLVRQHEQVKQGFAAVTAATGDARAEAFTELRRLLAVHETAEEEIVHPRARKEIPGGESIVSARLEEEKEAKQALAELEKLDVDSAEFTEKFTALRDAVIQHAQHEETEEFSQLKAELDQEELERMRKAVELAEQTAPTRPHAGVESRAANLLVGPFAAMTDRIRDLMSKH